MALLKNRPLMMAAVLFCAVLFLGFFLPPGALIGVCALAALLLGLSLLLLFRRGYSYRRLCLLVLSASLLLAGGRGAYESYRMREAEENYIGKAVTAEVCVREISYISSYSGELLVEIKSINGTRQGGRAVLRVEEAAPFSVGDRILADFTAQPLDYESYYEGAALSYRGEGASFILVLEDMSSAVLLESGSRSFASRLQVVRRVLAMRITSVVSGEAGNLISALLLGERDALTAQTVRDFRRIGVSHLLAISGLHLAIVAGMLDRLLLLLGATRRGRILAAMPLLVAYAFLVGGSYSVLRALIMLSVFYLAHLSKGEYDALTALSVTAALLAAQMPGVLFNLSFQMTVLATLGLLSLGRMQGALLRLIPSPKGMRRLPFALLRALVSSLVLTFSATLAILPVVWLSFGELSLLTPLSNLLLVPLITPLLLLGILTLLLPIAPLGTLCRLLGGLLLSISSALSSVNAVISLRDGFVAFIFIPLFLCLLLWLVLDLKRFRPLGGVPVLCAVLAFTICFSAARSAEVESLRVLYRRSGANEGLVFVQGGVAILCDSSNTSYSQLRADYMLASSVGATRVGALLLTHYHARAVSSVSAFSKTVILEQLWLPKPQTGEEAEILLALHEVARKNGFELFLFNYDEPIKALQGATLMLSAPLYEQRSVQPAYALSVRFGEDVLCYHTAALSEYERHLGTAHSCCATHLILGAHGPVPHEEVTLPDTPLCEVALPSEEVLRALSMKNGIKYYFYEEKIAFLLE